MSRPASPTRCRSHASGRTPWRSWSRPETRNRRTWPGCICAGRDRNRDLGIRQRHTRARAGQPRTARPRQVHSPAATALRAGLQRQFHLAGPHSGAEVIDLGAQAELFTLRDGVKRPPASVEKLYTTVALLHKLSPNTRLRTTGRGTRTL